MPTLNIFLKKFSTIKEVHSYFELFWPLTKKLPLNSGKPKIIDKITGRLRMEEINTDYN